MILKNSARNILIFFLLAAVLLLTQGCPSFTQTKKSAKKMATRLIPFKSARTLHPHLKRKVGIGPFEDKSGKDDGQFESRFQALVLKKLAETCSTLYLVKPEGPETARLLLNPPRHSDGQIDGFRLAQAAKPFGFNAVLSTTYYGVKSSSAQAGFVWLRELIPLFRNPKLLTKVQVEATLYDIETGAKLMDELFVQSIAPPENEMEGDKEAQKEENLKLQAALQQIATDMDEAICEAIRQQPWVGSVLSQKGNRVVITGGKKAGLKVHKRFDVFSTDILKGFKTEQFLLRGEKIAEIEIENVFADQAEAAVVSGGAIPPGSSVVPK